MPKTPPTSLPKKGGAYTFAQLEALWINNGGSAALAPLMAAIALAESSGIPTNTNPNDNNGRQTSWGLWQISDGTHNMPRPNILDPNVNAKAAVAKYKSQGLGAWGTYTSGAYRKYMKEGVPPDSNLPTTGSTSTADQASLGGDIGGAIGQGMGDAFKAVLEPFISMMIWGAEILGGIALMMVGTTLFALNTDKGKAVRQEARQAVTTAAQTAAPEVGIPLKLASRSGRSEALRSRVRETARSSPAGQRVAAEREEAKIRREQQSQARRKYVRQEAARRNRGNGQ